MLPGLSYCYEVQRQWRLRSIFEIGLSLGRPGAVVVKAIARASIWFEQLTTGNSQSMAEITVLENITDNYVSNLIHLAWLSPDLVGRVLDGDPEATTLARNAMLTRKSDVL